MTDKEKLVQMLLRCSMSTGHADTMDDLIAEAESQIMELRQKNAELVEALKFYACDCQCLDGCSIADCGDVARKALAKAKGGE